MASWRIGKPVQRLIVMVDIRDLKYIRRLIDTKPYLAAIRDCVLKILLLLSNNQYPEKNEISNTVWAFKIFDSSVSPYRSRSVIEKTLGKWAGHVSFESTTRTEAFVSALQHLANAKPNSQPRSSDFFHGGRLDFIIRSMQELLNDYIWDPLVIEDGISPQNIDKNYTNLVVLFSSFPWTRNGFNDFLMEETPGSGKSVNFPSSSDEDLLSKFSLKNKSLTESFRDKDIHFCWIDIPPIFPAHDIIECEISRERVVETFKAMKWSFVSLDMLLVASKSLPFELIWPTIAYSSSMFTSKRCKKIPGGLSMEVEGIDGRSVKGRICKLQCIVDNLDLIEDSSTCNPIAGSLDFSEFISKNKADPKSLINWDNVKIHIAEVFKREKCPDLSCVVSQRVLLRSFISEKAGNEDEDMDRIGDEILDRLQQENGEFCKGKPAWQLVLGFLSSKKCLALVTVFDGRHSCLPLSAVLEPFTVHVGMLYILDSTVDLRITRTSPFKEAVGDLSQENHDHVDVEQVSQENLDHSDVVQVSQENPHVVQVSQENPDVLQVSQENPSHGDVVQVSQENPNHGVLQVSQENPSHGDVVQVSQENPNHGDVVQVSQENCEVVQDSQENPDRVDVLQVSQETSGLTNVQQQVKIEVGSEKNDEPSTLCKRKRTTPSDVSSKRLKSSEVSAQTPTKSSKVSATPSKSDLQLIKYNTWDPLYTAIVCSLCKADPNKTTIDPTVKLESRYKKTKGTQSKISRFLSCWFAENSKKLDVDHDAQLKVSQLNENEEATTVLEKSTMESASVQEGSDYILSSTFSTDPASDSVAPPSSDNAETLIIGSLDEKIQYALCHDNIDLGTIAKCLVQQQICNLKLQTMEKNSESSDGENLSICEQAMNTLLKEPNQLVDKYKDCLLPRSSSAYTSKDKVREHELQILFRMEILSAPNITEGMEEAVKENCTEDICMLLENIQFNLSESTNGDSLIEFADAVIKSRYAERVPEIIDKVYESMDFLEPDASTSSANELISNDQDQENILLRLTTKRREKKQRDGGDEYERKLRRAQMKRERSKRFSHFASRAPDLKRVWTPKALARPKKLLPDNQSQTPETNKVISSVKPSIQEEIKTTSKIRDFLGREPSQRTIEFNISESEDEHENEDDKVKIKSESPKKTSIFRNFMVNRSGGKADADGLTALRERVQRASQIKKD